MQPSADTHAPTSPRPASTKPMSSTPGTPEHAPDQGDVKHGAIGHLSADEELQQAVCEALIDDAELDSSDIRVRAAGDTVVLSGSVATDEALQRAVGIARSKRGVSSVQTDEVTIRDA